MSAYVYATAESELVRKAKMVTAEIKAFEQVYLELRNGMRPNENWSPADEETNQRYQAQLAYYLDIFQNGVR